MRTPPIRCMVIDAISPFTSSLFGCRKMTNIPIVVVTPHQCHLVGNFQAGIIDVKHLFIGDKDLGYRRYIFVYILGYQPALVFKHAVQHGFLLSHRLHTCFPKIIDFFAVIHIVIGSFAPTAPFTGGITHHRFTVRTSYENTIVGSSLPVSFCQEERQCTLMHGWPHSVCPQAQHQFKYSAVRARSYMVFVFMRFIGLVAPRQQSPIFIVQEDTPIRNCRCLLIPITCRQIEGLTLDRCSICPPFPGRHTQHARKFQHAIGCSTLVTSCHQQATVGQHFQQ